LNRARFVGICVFGASLVSTSPLWAQSEVPGVPPNEQAATADVLAPDPSEYSESIYLGPVDSAQELWLESLGLVGLVTYTGFSDWKWGTASFRFNSEGWFGMNTGSGGIDKVGHAYGAYMSSELLYIMLRHYNDDKWVVSYYPPLFAFLLYNYIEFFDGFSVDHGWAYEDMIMNTTGVLHSLLRNTFPEVRKLFDFRLEYYPSEGNWPHPVIDYQGQKFFAVFKLAGIPGIERTPARMVEFFGAYYTRGFWDNPGETEKSAHFILGVGVSLEQLLFVPLERRYGTPFGFMRLVTNYFQFPYTYAYVEHKRTQPIPIEDQR